MNKVFRIGSFCFRIICDMDVPIPANFLLFEQKSQQTKEEDVTYRLIIQETLFLPRQLPLVQRMDLAVLENPSGESRLIGRLGKKGYYAYYRDCSPKEAEIFLAADMVTDLQIDTVFTSLFALERQMIKRQSMILHCAYINYQGRAILFSAPSETGKSTQADLWQRYRGSRTINGDRALLRKTAGSWYACGWPVCGSSEICHPMDTKIHAIVMLRQGKKNQIIRLTPIQAFSQLYSQITVNQWNRAFVQTVIEQIEDLLKTVSVWQLTCEISEEAVACLESRLF